MRKLKSGIIHGFCQYCEGNDKAHPATEVPAPFAIWTGISMVSACLRRECAMDQGIFVVYPNHYVVLVAGSGGRKSTVIDLAQGMLELVEPPLNILSQKCTPEALIGRLCMLQPSAENESLLVPSANAFFIADELITLIDQNAFKTGLSSLLTALYGCKHFDYDTKIRGTEKVPDSCLSILGGVVLKWIKNAIPATAVAEGLTARMVFVYAGRPDVFVPRPSLSSYQRELIPLIVNDLNEVRKLNGPFKLSDDAGKTYDEEYVRFSKESPFLGDINLAGYANRRHVILLKTAMAVSASRRSDLIVNSEDLQIALAALELAERGMPRVMVEIGSSDSGDTAEQVLRMIANCKVIDRSTVMRRFARRITLMELNAIAEGLAECGAIQISIDGRGAVSYIFMKELNE